MRRLLGLLGRLVALAGAVALGAAVWRALHPEAATGEIPPAAPIAPRPAVTPEAPAAVTSEPSRRSVEPAARAAWLPPIDGACPPGYPVKAKHGSEVFHVPGGASYERTQPDRCYRDAEAAVADGLRPAKR